MLLREVGESYGLCVYLSANESKCMGRQRKLYVAGRGDANGAGDSPSSPVGRSTSDSGFWRGALAGLRIEPGSIRRDGCTSVRTLPAPVYTLCHYCQVSWHMVTTGGCSGGTRHTRGFSRRIPECSTGATSSRREARVSVTSLSSQRWWLPSTCTSIPSWGIRSRRQRCRRLGSPALTRRRRTVERDSTTPSLSAGNSVTCGSPPRSARGPRPQLVPAPSRAWRLTVGSLGSRGQGRRRPPSDTPPGVARVALTHPEDLCRLSNAPSPLQQFRICNRACSRVVNVSPLID